MKKILPEELSKNNLNNVFAAIAFVLIFSVLPVFLPYGYAEVMKPKILCYAISVTVCFALSLYCDILYSKLNQKSILFNVKSKDKLLLLFFTANAFLSAVFSDYSANAFSGSSARYMGFLTTLVIFIAYLLFSTYFKASILIIRLMQITFCICIFWGYIQFLGIDIFGLFNGADYSITRNFLSPLGNLNVFSSYICLIAPIFMLLYCEDNSNGFDLITCIFIFVGLFISNSDSCYLGMFFAFTLLIYFGFSDYYKLLKASKLIFIFFITSFLISFFFSFAGESVRPISLLTKTITKKSISTFGLFISTIVYFILRRKTLNKNTLLKYKKIYSIIILSALILIIFLIIYFTFFNKTINGSLVRFFRIDKNWGTGRLYIWKLSLNEFITASPIHKLFGIGGDCLGKALYEHQYNEMFNSVYASYYDNAHNEFLQYFVTYGIFGIIFYLLFIATALRKAFAAAKNSAFNRAFTVGAICYLANSFVTITQPITTPLFFAILACATSEINNQN